MTTAGAAGDGATGGTGRTLLVAGGDVVTMNAAREVLAGGTVAIEGARIVGVGSTAALRAAHPDAEVLDASGCVVTPGLIDTHQHLGGGPMIRSCIPDDMAPGTSIFFWSVPLHGASRPEDEELSALLGAWEGVRNGVTTFVEAGTTSHPERVAAALERVGVRGSVGIWGWDVGEGPLAGPADEVLDLQRRTLDTIPTTDLVTPWVTLVGHSLASDELLAGAADLARSRGVGMTMHMSPTSSDPEAYLQRTGKRPIRHLADLGVLGPHLLLAHAVWIDDEEFELLLSSRTGVAYTPWAYLRLGQGVSSRGRHGELFHRGGRIGLGCDSGNAGDTVDVLRAAALAAGLARDSRIDPTWWSSRHAFEMATIGGAEAIGRAHELGSLEVGKLADLVVHDTSGPSWTPRGDLALQLVWSVDGRSVRDVVVGGQVVVRDARSTRIDEDDLRREAALAQPALFERAGITVPHPWPIVPAN